jgi:hypothetical protein
MCFWISIVLKVDLRRKPVQLEFITGFAIHDWVERRAIIKQDGADSWRTAEAKLLPPPIWEIAATMINLVERAEAPWPVAVAFASTSLIDKEGLGPLQKRPVTLLPIVYSAFAAFGKCHTKAWQKDVLPPELFGGRADLSTSSAELPAALELQWRKILLPGQGEHELHEVCLNEDRTKCFDLFKADQTVEVMRALGVFGPTCTAMRIFL